MCGFNHYNRILHGRAAFFEHAPTVTSTPPLGLPDGGVPETRKAPSNQGASFIFGAGQKRAPSVVAVLIVQGAGFDFVGGGERPLV